MSRKITSASEPPPPWQVRCIFGRGIRRGGPVERVEKARGLGGLIAAHHDGDAAEGHGHVGHGVVGVIAGHEHLKPGPFEGGDGQRGLGGGIDLRDAGQAAAGGG
ncbi:MAG: hypothetical protein R8G60_04760 [Roseovarius pacificus]|nr:hypothetical protein [Roseovarius pacificus]